MLAINVFIKRYLSGAISKDEAEKQLSKFCVPIVMSDMVIVQIDNGNYVEVEKHSLKNGRMFCERSC